MCGQNLSVVLAQSVDLIGDFSPLPLLHLGRNSVVELLWGHKDENGAFSLQRPP